MTDISIDDMIDARQQAQPGFRKANPSAGKDVYAQKLQASEDVPEEKKTETEQEITEDEVKEADTPEGKEDVRVSTEEAAARDDKAKAIEALGKAKEDEERAAEDIPEVEQSRLVRPDIDSLIAGRQWVPPMDFDIVGEDEESLTVRDPKTGETFVIAKS